MLILQLCRWKFHTRKLCSRLYSIEFEFYSKQKKTKNRFLSHTLGDFEMTYVGKPVVYFLFVVIIELFRYLLRLRRYKRKSVEVDVCRRGGHIERKFQAEGGIAHQPLLVSESWSDCPFVWYQNIRSALFGCVTMTRLTDGRTDRQNYDS